MSIEKATRLEDLKEEAEKILSERSKLVNSQRPLAIKSALGEMSSYLASQNFEIVHQKSPSNGFSAKYKDIQLKVSATGDDESFFGADYIINIEMGKNALQVLLSVNRGKRVDPPLGGSVDSQIKDYENRYLPALSSLSNDELDGGYYLSIAVQQKGKSGFEKLESGKAAIDRLFA